MNAEILCVGTEILLGDIVNTNAAYLARELAACGINSYYQSVVGDNPERLKGSLDVAFSRADLVVMTGGLGPTYDDLTKETVAAYFGREMVLDKATLALMEEYFYSVGRPMTENNRKQAYLPQGAKIFSNGSGTAPGLALEGGGKIAVLLPGPPREMTAMFESGVRPYLASLSDKAFRSHTIHFFGIGESALEHALRTYMERHENPTIAPYAKEGEVQLRVTASGATPEQADALAAPVIEEICAQFPEYVYGVDVGTLQNALVRALAEKGLMVATAESCTGGLVSKRITEIAGVSQVFGFGACTYSNEMKINLLGVSPQTIERYGAVSEHCAREMARGVRKLSGAQVGVSVTGIAGPGGATDEKPVGLVYIAVNTPAGEEAQELRLFRGPGDSRDLIRYLASQHALHLSLQMVRAL